MDGLDEHALGHNNDVLKVIRHQKYLLCNIILTSRPHSTREIEQHFDTIVKVKGFTRNEARKFALYIVLDDSKVEQILDFNPAGNKRDIVLSKCPILLSFMCMLVREEELDLTSKTMSHGEIYTRMIQCLYKKFCNRANIEFEDEKCFKAITSLGKLALETLVSGDALFQRSRVVKEVGEEVFDYGLLIGNEDMINHLIADILITFPHRSIQEFLGALYFVLMLSAGASIYSLLKHKGAELVLLENPLFLHFCFWLLSDKCQKHYKNVVCPNRDKACEALYLYIIKGKQLNFRNITEAYPTIDIHDEVCREHLEKMLGMFHNMKYLTLNHHLAVQWIFNRSQHLHNTLKVFVAEDENQGLHNVTLPHLARRKDSDCTLNIVLATRAHNRELFNSCLNSGFVSDRSSSVSCFFADEDSIELSTFLHRDLQGLLISCIGQNAMDLKNFVQSYPFFTSLSIVGNKGNILIKSNVLLALNRAVREGRLPNLKYLRFAKASGLKKRLKYLFDDRSTYAALTHLCLFDCDLSVEDMQTLGAASTNSTPKIASLVLTDDTRVTGSGQWTLFSHRRTNLTRLSILNMTTVVYKTLADVISKGLLSNLIQLRLSINCRQLFSINHLKPDQIPHIKYLGLQKCLTKWRDLVKLANISSKWELRTLDISHSLGITGNLSQLLSCNFKFLKTLILSDCGLNSEDLSSLAEAKVEGRLDKLIHLDISKNSYRIESVFNHSCKWECLRRLNMANEGSGYYDVLYFERFLLRGCLSSLRELRLTSENWDFTVRSPLWDHGCWSHIERLEIIPSRQGAICVIFSDLALSVEKVLFPNLETVCVLCDTQKQIEEEFKVGSKTEKNLHRLRRSGVIVHFIQSDTEKIYSEIGLS